jgi:murein DD-endopeptidase MepM/ murein hydrolase activator NlpD
MAITTLSSPLKSAANKIVAANLNSSTSLSKAKKEYIQLRDFLEVKTKELENTPIPNKRALRKLGSINVVNTFGSAGGLLEGLLGGALDLGGLVSGFFPGENKKIGSAPNVRNSKPRAALKGGKLNLGGVKALGIANAVFAGLDFATGLAEGESVGKSAAGTSGALAGSLLGGAIGQALIPIPGVGFVIGSAAGSFLGGYTADRAFDAVASQNVIKAEQEAKLKAQSKSQDEERKSQVQKQNNLLDTFSGVAEKFQSFVNIITRSEPKPSGLNANQEDMPMDYGLDDNPGQGDPGIPGELQDVIAEGGELPSAQVSSRYGWRDGRIHAGVDYPRNTGTPVSLIQPGVVTYAGEYPGYGNYVEVSHPGGNSTSYAHLSRINVRVGQQIEPGMVIGNTGSTGKSTGPHVHFELRPNGGSPVPIGDKEGDKYFRFGGNVRVRPKPGGQTSAVQPQVQTGVKPGEVISTAFGRQGSTSIANYGRATKTNIKGFIIVPGHIAGEGAPGEPAAVEKIAKNIVDQLQRKYPGVPIRFWNNRTYGQNQAEFTRQMNDLKKLEDQGWEVIEIHMDASIESGIGKGRGVIVPFGAKNLNEFDVRFASQKGSFDPKHRGGIGTNIRNLTAVETGNMNPIARAALDRGDQSAINFFSSDVIQILEQMILEGKIGGGYRPRTSAVAPVQPQPRIVDQRMSYRPSPSTTIVNNTPIIAMTGGGGGSRTAASPPSVAPSKGGSSVAIVITDSMGAINKIQEMKYA